VGGRAGIRLALSSELSVAQAEGGRAAWPLLGRARSEDDKAGAGCQGLMLVCVCVWWAIEPNLTSSVQCCLVQHGLMPAAQRMDPIPTLMPSRRR
jgi:hypothetical protein